MQASKECIKYFINQAIERKKWAYGLTFEWYKEAAVCSRAMAAEYQKKSIHVLAREMMNYARIRAKLGGLDKYPWDCPARMLWFKLNPAQTVQVEPLINNDLHNQLAALWPYQIELLNTIKEREKTILNLPRNSAKNV